MSVQKITGLTQQKKSLKPNNAVNNSFLSNISFKGYTKQVTMQNGTQPHRYGTSGSLYSGRQATVEPYNINHPEDTSVTIGKKGYTKQDYDSATVDVYYADLGEKITDEIRNKHAYIVEYDKMPELISEEQIKNASSTSEMKGLVARLEKREAIIKVSIEQTEDEITSAQDYLEATRKAYEAADNKYNAIVQEKITQEAELEECKQRLKLAKAEYQKLKKAEEEAYISAQTVSILQEAKGKLNELNSSDSNLANLMAQIEKFLNGFKG